MGFPGVKIQNGAVGPLCFCCHSWKRVPTYISRLNYNLKKNYWNFKILVFFYKVEFLFVIVPNRFWNTTCISAPNRLRKLDILFFKLILSHFNTQISPIVILISKIIGTYHCLYTLKSYHSSWKNLPSIAPLSIYSKKTFNLWKLEKELKFQYFIFQIHLGVKSSNRILGIRIDKW